MADYLLLFNQYTRQGRLGCVAVLNFNLMVRPRAVKEIEKTMPGAGATSPEIRLAVRHLFRGSILSRRGSRREARPQRDRVCGDHEQLRQIRRTTRLQKLFLRRICPSVQGWIDAGVLLDLRVLRHMFYPGTPDARGHDSPVQESQSLAGQKKSSQHRCRASRQQRRLARAR